MGISKLKQQLEDPDLKEFFEGIFPKDHPKNARFSINFFYSIGLNPLTHSLRQYLFEEAEKKEAEVLAIQNQSEKLSDISDEDDSIKEEVHVQTIESQSSLQEPKEIEVEEVGESALREGPKEDDSNDHDRYVNKKSLDLLKKKSKHKKDKKKTKKISKKKKKLKLKKKRKRSIEVSPMISSGSSLSDD